MMLPKIVEFLERVQNFGIRLTYEVFIYYQRENFITKKSPKRQKKKKKKPICSSRVGVRIGIDDLVVRIRTVQKCTKIPQLLGIHMDWKRIH